LGLAQPNLHKHRKISLTSHWFSSQIKLPDLAGEDIQREQPQERKTNQNNLRISKG